LKALFERSHDDDDEEEKPLIKQRQHSKQQMQWIVNQVRMKGKVNLPINSNASWKYCLMFWLGVSLAGICLYLTPGLFCVVDG